jgi:hypothetical protein
MKDLDDFWKYQLATVVDPFDADPTIALRRRHPFLGAEKWIGDRKLAVSVGSHGQDMRGGDGTLSA